LDDQTFTGGDVIDGRFRLRSQIGAGGFGVVWAGTDLGDGKEVAIKVLHPSLSEHPELVMRFQREIDVMARLDHPNIAHAVAAGGDDRCRYLAMEFVQGRTLLADMVARTKSGERYQISEALELGSAMASALDLAHSSRIVHRDLKPGNVMVRKVDGKLTPTILDFGIAKVEVEVADRTTLGRRLGTLMYMSPEQLRGEAVDARTDVFALAVILYEVLTLRRLFARMHDGQPARWGQSAPGELNNHPAVMARIAAEDRPKPSLFRPELGARIDEVLLRALDHAPKNRFESAGDLVRALADAIPESQELTLELTQVDPQPLTSIELAPTARLEPRERTRVPAWAIALFAAATVTTTAIYLRTEQPQPIAIETIAPPLAPPIAPKVEPRLPDPPPTEPSYRDGPPRSHPSAEPPPAKLVRKDPPRPPPPRPKIEPPRPARDPAITSMLRELESDDPAAASRVSRTLETQSDRLRDPQAQQSIRHCAALSALRKKDLLACVERLESMLGK
jgi:eukaryotic-like serine/threonine-protein kinase